MIAVVCYTDGNPKRHVQQPMDIVIAEVRLLAYICRSFGMSLISNQKNLRSH